MPPVDEGALRKHDVRTNLEDDLSDCFDRVRLPLDDERLVGEREHSHIGDPEQRGDFLQFRSFLSGVALGGLIDYCGVLLVRMLAELIRQPLVVRHPA